MLEVKSVDQVIEILNEEFSRYELKNEVVDIIEAVDRVIAVDVYADEDIPRFDRSSVDGYAVIAADTFGAGEAIPAQLYVTGEVKMGERPLFSIERGKTAYIPTGGELPENADSVVMIEYTEDMGDEYIYINKPAAPGNNVVYRGDDVKAGQKVIKTGNKLRPQDIGVLAALGIDRVSVKKRIKIGIISTGDEIIDINRTPVGAQVRDINSYAIYSAIKQYGGEPVMYGIVKDVYEDIFSTTQKAFKDCDIVLVSGGSSVGTRDETYKVINSLGMPGVLVHGIAVKPGKPTIIGKVGNKAVIGLPGHPASAFFILKILVFHLMDVINKVSNSSKNLISAKMSCNYPSNNGREEYVPVRLHNSNEGTIAQPLFGKSGLITLLSSADGYVRIDRGSEGISAGEMIKVIQF